MIDYSNPVLLQLRHYGQRINVLRPMVRQYRRIFRTSYEHNFDKAMLDKIEPGDIVWDIGANVGYFARKFALKLRGFGSVYAFEPAKGSFEKLELRCAELTNVHCMNIALSEASGIASFKESSMAGDPTNRLAEASDADGFAVSVASGDDLVTKKSLPMPNAIKIDVEGFEVEVIRGMRKTVLKSPALKKLFVEVHFLELSKRGLSKGPNEIVAILREAGFAITWTDPSHFVALR